MKTRALLLVVVAAGMLPASAQADYGHVVLPGETLTSIAATDGLSVDAVAQANGISPDAELITGQLIEIPPQTSATIASTTTDTATAATTDTAATTSTASDTDGDSDDSGATYTDYSQSSGGAYVVQPGDTLTSIAARAGTTVSELAAYNGLSPLDLLVAGTALRLPAAGTTTAQTVDTSDTSTTGTTSTGTTSTSTGSTSQGGPPYPTSETVSGSEIASIAAEYGVPASLAEAIGWQESGWNNSEVSSVGAVGVMQIVPSTWSWINQNLTPSNPLGPASASENVRGGVLLLHDLLSLTGGNAAMAAAGYYQGLASVQAHGMYSDTKQYVQDVLALQQRLGG